MSYVDHQTKELNVKVVWLANAEADLAGLQERLWAFRSKPSLQRLDLQPGSMSILDLRLPPYPKFNGYRLRFHLFAPSDDVQDEGLWKGADAAVVDPETEVPAGVLRIERPATADVVDIAHELSAVTLEALHGEGGPQRPNEEPAYVQVGPLPFLVNLEGLEPLVDHNDERARLRIETPNNYDLIVLVYPSERRTSEELMEQASETWGEPRFELGPVLAGFRSTRAIFDRCDDGAEWEVLAVPLRDSILAVMLRKLPGAEAVEELRRYFLAMLEGAILRSDENRPR